MAMNKIAIGAVILVAAAVGTAVAIGALQHGRGTEEKPAPVTAPVMVADTQAASTAPADANPVYVPAAIEIIPATTSAPAVITDPPTKHIRSMTLQQLGYFPYDAIEGGVIPDKVKALDGTRVRLRGYVVPQVQSDAITEFLFSPWLICCNFVPPPGVQHMVLVHLEKPGIDYTQEEVWVEGTLHVKEERENDYTTQIFSLDGDLKSIKRAGP